jgi:hypothetical protein
MGLHFILFENRGNLSLPFSCKPTLPGAGHWTMKLSILQSSPNAVNSGSDYRSHCSNDENINPAIADAIANLQESAILKLQKTSFRHNISS